MPAAVGGYNPDPLRLRRSASETGEKNDAHQTGGETVFRRFLLDPWKEYARVYITARYVVLLGFSFEGTLWSFVAQRADEAPMEPSPRWTALTKKTSMGDPPKTSIRGRGGG